MKPKLEYLYVLTIMAPAYSQQKFRSSNSSENEEKEKKENEKKEDSDKSYALGPSCDSHDFDSQPSCSSVSYEYLKDQMRHKLFTFARKCDRRRISDSSCIPFFHSPAGPLPYQRTNTNKLIDRNKVHRERERHRQNLQQSNYTGSQLSQLPYTRSTGTKQVQAPLLSTPKDDKVLGVIFENFLHIPNEFDSKVEYIDTVEDVINNFEYAETEEALSLNQPILKVDPTRNSTSYNVSDHRNTQQLRNLRTPNKIALNIQSKGKSLTDNSRQEEKNRRDKKTLDMSAATGLTVDQVNHKRRRPDYVNSAAAASKQSNLQSPTLCLPGVSPPTAQSIAPAANETTPLELPSTTEVGSCRKRRRIVSPAASTKRPCAPLTT
ncbi:unnamed protein product [Brassicogethes aeneus]|uniref:Uncharacterized protein n=1 Tax=Brassicogethes aeneus TaxID=1431903 RepID=A0A9P0FMG6_BRAAE|nr:unnamed protein product [Brassicogethes aeneus]